MWASTQIGRHPVSGTLHFKSPFLSPIKSSQNNLEGSVSNICSNWWIFGWYNLYDLFCQQNGFQHFSYHEFQDLNVLLWWERCLSFRQNSSLKYVFLRRGCLLRLLLDRNHSSYYYVNSSDFHWIHRHLCSIIVQYSHSSLCTFCCSCSRNIGN